MTQILESFNNHPKEIKRVIGITDKQFKKSNLPYKFC